MPRRVLCAALLVGLAATTTACSGEPVLHGARTVTVPAVKAAGFGYPGLEQRTLRGARLDGPHYTLAVQWVATGAKLEQQAADLLGTSPVRAADGEQLVLAAVDPARAYAAFPARHDHPVRVSVLVAGHATSLPRLPVRPAHGSRAPASTQLVELSAARGASVVLKAVDDGHTEELDLRTGRVLVDTYRIEQGEARWDSKVPVAAYWRGHLQRDSIDALNAVGAENAAASLTTYTPAYGWAPKGRAFLSVPMPRLVCGLLVCGILHEEFDDAKAFRFQPSHGRPVAAEKGHRDLPLESAGGEKPGSAVVFEVPDSVTSGTVSLNLAAARLTEPGAHSSRHRGTVSWTRPPGPLTLSVRLAS
ncbi:MAG TPA: hypothetical protein VF053_21215 [Streptosporangiales bacterium]